MDNSFTKLQIENKIAISKKLIVVLIVDKRATGRKCMITIMPGSTGIKQAYEEALKADKLDVQCLSENYVQVLGDHYDRVISPALDHKQVREIIPESPENRASQSGAARQTRLLPQAPESESDVLLTSDTAYLVCFNEEQPYAVKVSDGAIVAALQALFNQSWKTLET